MSIDAFNGNDRYPKVMVVHLTTVARAGGPFRWEVDLPRGTAGLPAASTAECNEVYTILKTQLSTIVGTLPRSHLDRVDRALALTLGVDRVR